MNISSAQDVEKKATVDFLNKQFYIHSTSLLWYLRQNSDVDEYCQKILDEHPQYRSKAIILSAIVQPERRLPRCVICGELIPYKLAKNKKKNYFCSSKCAMSEEGKKIQVELYRISTNGINGMKRPEVKEKQRQTIFKNHGVYNPSHSPEIRAKANKTTFERYGVYNMFEHPDVKKKLLEESRKRHYDDLVKSMNDDEIDVLYSFEDYEKRALNGEKVPYRCKKCGNIFERRLHSKVYCKKCVCPGTSSKPEYDLFLWISSISKCNSNDKDVLKNGCEIDIYLEDKKIGFEYDGLYWHSEKRNKNKNYHLEKTTTCENQGIRLIHIFEDEWFNKNSIVKSRIKNLLGVTPYKIYARKCEIKFVDCSLCNKFLEKYHLQGKDNSSIRLGLYYKNRLVAVMTFGKPRFNKNYRWELIRYATLSNFNIIGGAGKLLSYFKKKYEGSIITYADRRWSRGKLYEKLGFSFKENTRPNYFYTKGYERLSRYKCQKHKLKSLLKDKFNPELSEKENMVNNKYYRIWDCGNKVYTLDN